MGTNLLSALGIFSRWEGRGFGGTGATLLVTRLAVKTLSLELLKVILLDFPGLFLRFQVIPGDNHTKIPHSVQFHTLNHGNFFFF
jgi:hypothetical protein